VNVAGQHRREATRYVSTADHVRRSRERVVRGSHRRAFHALVQAQQAHVGVHARVLCIRNQVGEPGAHVVTFRRNPGHRYANAPHLGDKGPRPIEDMNARMMREPQVRDATALMVARYHINRHAFVGDASQWLEGLPHHAAIGSRAVEHVSSVHNQVDFAIKGRLQRGRVVGQEVVPAPSPVDARVQRQVEAEVGVGQ
jgi:hypothetical protein